MGDIIHDFRKKEIEIFPRRGLTGMIGLKRQAKLVFGRGGIRARERLVAGLADRQSNISAPAVICPTRQSQLRATRIGLMWGGAKQTCALAIRATIEAGSSGGHPGWAIPHGTAPL
jgi:hypothetical protein